ncbi:hypothetical protein [uncultured Methanobrevibacter sp.]|uniref:hypothetical protein n=1 Tax=uncultured Methanobrevibacter sp. TaxID=253161 RepID=UPI0025FC304E|nr:hypothetical protein [uncultured Methanobrevibacter sp.]
MTKTASSPNLMSSAPTVNEGPIGSDTLLTVNILLTSLAKYKSVFSDFATAV